MSDVKLDPEDRFSFDFDENSVKCFSFFKERGYSLEALKTCAGGLGCNEFVFQRTRL